MKRRLYHPLWTHLPALALLAIIALEFARHRWVFSHIVPVHFNLAGQPDRWGSGWELLLAAAIPALCLCAVSLLIDELWARQERRKTFNWMAVFDEVTLGVFAGMTLAYFRQAFLGEEGTVGYISAPVWPWMLGVVLAAVAGALLLEWLRPFRPAPAPPRVEATALTVELREQEGRRWVYWEVQNPRWLNPLIVLTSGALVVGAVLSWRFLPALALLNLLFGLALLLLYGGLRVSVTRERLAVRLGVLGVRLLTLPLADLATAEVYDFSPLRDFGGYGIRFNRQMTAFFLRGNRGVLVRTQRGKQYLIGSDTPEQLAVVLQSVWRPREEQA